jgi:quercetin dioxygenase-like cupin family protein
MGSVRVDYLFQAVEPGRAGGGLVTFEPGARTAWHRRPLGQSLVVVSGMGCVPRKGGRIDVIRPGDVVTIGPNEKARVRRIADDRHGLHRRAGSPRQQGGRAAGARD